MLTELDQCHGDTGTVFALTDTGDFVNAVEGGRAVHHLEDGADVDQSSGLKVGELFVAHVE